MALIDFETLPGGGTPSDNLALGFGDTYIDDGVEVQFGYDPDGFTGGLNANQNMVFEKTGNDSLSGFWYDSSVPTTFDSEAVGGAFGTGSNGGLKDYFLRTNTPVSGAKNSFEPGALFVIEYVGGFPANAASGEIWDIDTSDDGFYEEWTVTAWNYDGISYTSLGTDVSPGATYPNNDDQESRDGQAWTFSFDNLSDTLTHITIAFTGSKTTNIGLAFDNFNAASPVPEPSTYAAIFGGLALGLAVYRRRLRK